jgi:urea transport system ATP-binding protein
MLEVQDITLRYGQSQILHGVSLEAARGEVTALMGTNGVGKTSLLKAIAGRYPFSGGRIVLDGVDLGHSTAFGAAKAGIAYVPQGREIFPLLTVRENLETGFACLPGADRAVPGASSSCSPCSSRWRTAGAGTCRAGSSSSWPSRGR